jgi:hypothetical protein
MVEVNTTEYEFSHGRKPRGYGSWAFRFEGDIALHWYQGTYSEARSAARKAARKAGAASIEVCS